MEEGLCQTWQPPYPSPMKVRRRTNAWEFLRLGFAQGLKGETLRSLKHPGGAWTPGSAWKKSKIHTYCPQVPPPPPNPADEYPDCQEGKCQRAVFFLCTGSKYAVLESLSVQTSHYHTCLN